MLQGLDAAIAAQAGLIVTIGRLLMGGLFVVAGLRHPPIINVLAGRLRERKLPYPVAIVWIGTVFETVVGALLMLNVAPRADCIGLILFTLLASWMMFDAWNTSGDVRRMQLNSWQNNIGLIGGLLVGVAVFG